MATAWFRFYEELNDFILSEQRQRRFDRTFTERASVKDMIEALGVPHTEIDLILVNGRSVDFSYLVQDGDQISVYPVFESFDITPVLRLRPAPLRDPRFVVDVNLGKLARYLRLFGFDAWYRRDYADAELARLASDDKRIVLTRDVDLLKWRIITRGYFVRSTVPCRQISEVLARLDLYRSARPFTRCTRCNGGLIAVSKEQIAARLAPNTHRCFDRFWRCQGCGRIYWRGGHYERMRQWVEIVLRGDATGGGALPSSSPGKAVQKR
jgi:uncharacterized protein with PIN domain